MTSQAPPEGLKESPTNEIGYATVADALAALRSQQGVQISQQGAWTIVTDTASRTIWSFTPPQHPAHPAAVKRSIATRGGTTYVDMNVLCEASKAACDKLVLEFQQLNDRMIASMQGRHPPPPQADTTSPPQGPASAATPEQVNITTDSASGWLPSANQRARVPRVAKEYLAALDTGDLQKAYDLEAPAQKALDPFDSFVKRVTAFNAQAGAPKERRILKITWTKDPARAPAPGIYAAVDIASRFEKVDRHCGYIVLYQRDAVAPLLVVREENNYITNDNARQIAQSQSPEALEEMWNRLRGNCPNNSTAPANSAK